ncbi:helix-turn-helix domain-containing protein [Sphingobacterium siyangense subsp. cladoniae]|uniref:helix-turn-helix domain-containing protein n=1 Tax=Sphingobacterium siyangense TaxID=459529 RepID=UPI0031FA228A
MEKTFAIDTITAFNTVEKSERRHPLVNLYKQPYPFTNSDNSFLAELYTISLAYAAGLNGKIWINCPGQQIIPEENEANTCVYHTLAIHPLLIQGTSLMKIVNDWKTIALSSSSLLHLSKDESEMIESSFASIDMELDYSPDRHSKKLIACHIERILNYCFRFFERQTQSDSPATKGILKELDLLLNEYFTSGNSADIGLPSVSYFADQMHHSTNYFGDLIKKETGKSAKDYIQARIIDEAKNRIYQLDRSITEIAFELGFRYPQHFSKFFKKRVGSTPNDFRKALAIDAANR